MSAKTETENRAEEMQDIQNLEADIWQIKPTVSLRPGMICPRCQESKIEYDGLLHLVCPNCGLTESGACT